METILKLAILVLVTAFGVVMAWVGVGFAGSGLLSIVAHSLLILIPLGAIAWTLKSHFKSVTTND